ncbi:hypothetical protein SAMN05518861_15310 [Mesorhizobium sp. YR577]|nr:hypothetical protein SAMN05518861_15310 [Mesorhizobium sp. YR577]
MTSRATAKILLSMLFITVWALGATTARAQLADGWRFGNGSNGQFTASVFSTNTMSTDSSRVIEYHPVFTIGCRAGGNSNWTQSIQLRESLSRRQAIDLDLRIDGSAFSEQWSLGFQNRSFFMDGDAAVARLLGASRFRAVWRISFLSGNGEADFNLTGISDALTKIAGSCGVPLP